MLKELIQHCGNNVMSFVKFVHNIAHFNKFEKEIKGIFSNLCLVLIKVHTTECMKAQAVSAMQIYDLIS